MDTTRTAVFPGLRVSGHDTGEAGDERRLLAELAAGDRRAAEVLVNGPTAASTPSSTASAPIPGGAPT